MGAAVTGGVALAVAAGGAVEVGRFVRDPADEARERGVAAKGVRRRVIALDLVVGERRVDGAVADRVDRRHLGAAA